MSMNPNCQTCGEEDGETVLCTKCTRSLIAAAVAETKRDAHAKAMVLIKEEIDRTEGLIAAAVAAEREAWREAAEASISHCRTDCTFESFCGQCEPLLAILTARGGR